MLGKIKVFFCLFSVVENSKDCSQGNLNSSLKPPVDHDKRRKSSRIKTKTNIPSSDLDDCGHINNSDTANVKVN